MTVDESIQAATSWLQFLELLREPRDHITLRFRYEVNLDIEKEDALREWKNWCRDQRFEVDQAIHQWMKSGRLPHMPPEIEFGLWIRLVIVDQLIDAFLYQPDTKTWASLVPAPPQKDHNYVLEAFLLSWWHARGIPRAFEAIFHHTMTAEPQ